MEFPTVTFVIISTFTIALTLCFRARRSSKLPPGPYQLPIIGNILEMGTKPHQSLAKLSRKYGPLMSLKLGSKTTIVVSSPEIAKIVLQKHDVDFSSRSVSSSIKHVEHDKFSVAYLPIDNQWRKLRKILKEEMLSVTKVDASQGLRNEKLQQLRDYVTQCSETGRAVDIGAAAFTTVLNLLSDTLFSVEFGQFSSDSSQEMKDVVNGILTYVSTPNLADYFPILESIDPQGISKKLKIYVDKLMADFNGIIDEKLKSRGGTNDFLDALLDINQRNEAELSRDEIIHLLLDVFVAGTDTTSSTVEWAMTELLCSPDKMSRVRDEIKDVIRKKGEVEESDIPSLPYLQAVVKETFRLHPALPFLVPHKAESDIEIKGYLIPKNAQILINVWASGRDPVIWTKAYQFLPERFLTGKYEQTDFRGKHFELIPFGAGRRICPGLPLAYKMVHLMLATFVGSFEWKFEQLKQLDMDEKFGLTLKKTIPLKVVPIKSAP